MEYLVNNPGSSSKLALTTLQDNKVVFCTGGSGSICSAQVKAMVCLGANACIVGRNVEKVERVAKNIEMEREGSRVLGIGSVDVRNVQALQAAVERCAKELGSIDFVIAGAAGNFLAPFRSLSPNAFKAVIDIDVLGSFNVAKLTVPYLIKSAAQSRAGDDDGKVEQISRPNHADNVQQSRLAAGFFSSVRTASLQDYHSKHTSRLQRRASTHCQTIWPSNSVLWASPRM